MEEDLPFIYPDAFDDNQTLEKIENSEFGLYAMMAVS